MRTSRHTLLLLPYLALSVISVPVVVAQEHSLKPGINKGYENASVEQKIKQFERNDRDVVRKLDEIVAACALKPGMDVADIGAGTGLFTRPFAPKVLPGGKVYAALCEKDDLISVPASTRHWFDMGPNPSFTAIRLFNNPEGWVADFTGDNIAGRFPLLEN